MAYIAYQISSSSYQNKIAYTEPCTSICPVAAEASKRQHQMPRGWRQATVTGPSLLPTPVPGLLLVTQRQHQYAVDVRQVPVERQVTRAAP